MDCGKVGKLINALRKEKNMTQKQLADAMNLSDRTVSKWERGMGCPDVSLLHELSNILGVNIEKLLTGEMDANDKSGGSMKKISFYMCPTCENVLFSMGDAEISCCGRKLVALKSGLEAPEVIVEEIEDDYYVRIDHEMIKSHYISFIACAGYDRVLFIKLYPEQNAEARFPRMSGYKLYGCCSQHGLWEKSIHRTRS